MSMLPKSLLVALVLVLLPGTVNAQVVNGAGVTPQILPTDATPFTVSPEVNEFTPGYKFRIFQALPERFWFNTSTEVSQRLDTNVFFTYSSPKPDYAFRVLPNLTAGYEVSKNTSVYANYFVIKDSFADNTILSPPTTQSLSWGLQYTKSLGKKTSLQLDFQARELWQISHLRQFDFLPGLSLTHVRNPNNIAFASTLLQLRGGKYFVAPTREIDPFFTLGYIHRRGAWTFVFSDTFVMNYRSPPFRDSIPQQGNFSMISDIEVIRPVLRQIPSLQAFVRAEPVWNWNSDKQPGLSGFDFRIYGGLRFVANKPSYYTGLENLRQQIMESENEQSKNEPSTN